MKPIYKSISGREIDGDSDSNTLDDMCSLGVQLRCVTIMGFLLAVFKTIALVVLQQSVLPTIMTIAEPTVADNSLGTLFAVFVSAADLLRRHSTTKRRCQV
jgi:hypothetical protein